MNSILLDDTARNGIDFANSLIALPSQIWCMLKVVGANVGVNVGENSGAPCAIVASRAQIVTETKETILI